MKIIRTVGHDASRHLGGQLGAAQTGLIRNGTATRLNAGQKAFLEGTGWQVRSLSIDDGGQEGDGSEVLHIVDTFW